MNEITAALEALESKGPFCASQTISSEEFDIKVNKVGTLAYPLKKGQIEALIAVAKPAKFGWRDQTILDKSVRKVWEISAAKIKIGKRQWQAKFGPLLASMKTALGLPQQSGLKAELHNMLIYAKGDFFKPHQDSEKIDGMVATLVVVLPSAHSGGELVIDHRGVKKRFPFNARQRNKLSCIAFYADCYHEVKKVTAGHRVALTYNVRLENYTGRLESLYEPDFYLRLRQACQHYFSGNAPQKPWYERPTPPRLVYLLDHQYTQKGLAWQRLKSADSVRVGALLKIADELGLDAYLALADMQETWNCEHWPNYYRGRSYYDDEDGYDDEGEPTELIETETVLKHWRDRQGKPAPYGDFSPSSREVCWTGSNAGFKPYETEYEPWTGNAGNTLDKWYHRAAVVLWRKVDHYAVFFSTDAQGVLDDIFARMKKKTAPAQLQKMLQSLMPYWGHYIGRNKDEINFRAILRLALYVEDKALSHTLLAAYDIGFFNTSTLVLWTKLIQAYGVPWGLALLAAMTDEKKKHRQEEGTHIKNFAVLSQKLVAHGNYEKIIAWLIQYQSKRLQARHQLEKDTAHYRKNAPQRVEEIGEFIGAAIFAGAKKNHQSMLNYILQHEKAYPPVYLAPLFEQCAPKLGTSANRAAWGYKKLFNATYKALVKEEAQGLRRPGDWSIQAKSSCTCMDCKALNKFLHNACEQQKVWPLNEGRRMHIQNQIYGLDVPVDYHTKRQGSPYQLVLTKTEALYRGAKRRYKAVCQAKNKLELLWRKLSEGETCDIA